MQCVTGEKRVMSTSLTAILYYGIELGDERPDEIDFNSPDDIWNKEHRPQEPVCDRTVKDYSRTPEWDAWRERFREWEKTPEHIELFWSGGEGCENHYVSCSGLEKSVDGSEQMEVGPDSFSDIGTMLKADSILKEFCERFELLYKQPTWHLAARYF